MKPQARRRIFGTRLAVVALGIATCAAFPRVCLAQTSGQSPQPESFTLDAAVKYALEHYPAVRAAIERKAAATAGIGVARTNYLPRADALWQGNRATHNNFFGLLFPQSVVPSISGPVLPASSSSGAWDSAAGLLVSWQPIDFGYRASLVSAARAREGQSRAEALLTRLDVASTVVSAYFSVISAQQQIAAAKSDVDRRQALANQIGVLVKNELRPGADASRANAELAGAQIRLIQATTAERIARISLSDLLGIPPDSFTIPSEVFLQLPPEQSGSAPDVSSNPAAQAQDAKAEIAAADLHTLDREYFPKFYLQSSISGRGTGLNTDGSSRGGASGLDLQRENWAVGAQVTFPLMDIFGIHAQKQVASAELRAEKAGYAQSLQDLRAQVDEVRASAAGARSVAEATPAELQAARDAESQARARYESGLASIAEVVDAQSLLAQAEANDAIAKLNAWGALASIAEAGGDIEPFLAVVRQAGGH